MMKMDDGFGNGTIRACSIKPILSWAWFAPPPIPEAFPINPTPLNLHKRFLTGGFLQTEVSDAPRTTSASTCHSLWGASGFLLPMNLMCSVNNVHYTLKPTSTYSGALDTLKLQLNRVLRSYLGGAVGSVVYKFR